jgi:hypothetical protein
MVTFVATGGQLHFSQSQWALGYASGLNAAWKLTSGSDPLGNTEVQRLFDYTQRYCTDNPERLLLNAVTDWFTSLRK